jgi:pSer/pThr/pTyr-binding forkhead associated (FHA) protein
MPESWTIGSHPDCDLVVQLPTVSGRHCRLTRDDRGYLLEDLGSTNGTFLDGERLAGPARISRGDAVTLGLTAPLPWPPEPAPGGERPTPATAVVFRIGRDPDNDLVLDAPAVSGHHARVVWDGTPGGATIEDLGSANGTALGSRDGKVARAALTAADTIYLGSYELPAARVLARISPTLVPSLTLDGDELVVGRSQDCGQTIDLPMISGRHARLFRSGDRVLIEDLGSANGTFVNGRWLEGQAELRPGDAINLGSHLVVFAGGSAVAATREGAMADQPRTAVTPILPATAPPSADGEQAAPGREGPAAGSVPPWRWVVLLAQAPLAAIVLVAAARAGGPGPGSASSVAATLFGLGLAAIWFGISDAVLGRVAVAPGPGLFVAGAVCVGQCVLAWGIVAAMAGLNGPGLPSLALLILASAVGLALGLVLNALAPRPATAWAVVGLTMLPLLLLGGGLLPLPRMAAWARPLANALPSRWAFEGLLLLEADRTPAPRADGGEGDLAEGYFPADTERMGTRADALALGSMVLGLSAAAAFIASASRPRG